MRVIPILCCVAAAVILAFGRASWGEPETLDEPIEDPVDETEEPITGDPVMPNPGSEQPLRDPFSPYDIGGAEAAWRLEDLEPEEQEIALLGAERNPQATQDSYAEAAQELAEQARVDSAARTLQIDHLGALGVVP